MTPKRKSRSRSCKDLQEGKLIMDPFKVHQSKKFTMEKHGIHLAGEIRQRKAKTGEQYIISDFYPRAPKLMTSSTLGSTGEKYLAQALATQTPPKWFRELSVSEYQIFIELHEYLKKSINADPSSVKEILDKLDIDLTMEEVEEAVRRCQENRPGEIDFCQILFELCNAKDYLQRMKHDKNLRKSQTIGMFTKRQILFYSISTVATFPHFSRDPIFHNLRNKYRPHVLKYFCRLHRAVGLSTRQLLKEAKELEKISGKMREKYSCPLNGPVSIVEEPVLVRQQRWLKEGNKKKFRVSDMSSFISSESSEVLKIPIHKRIETLALNAYKKFAKPVTKYPPQDWNRHAVELTMVPLPVVRYPAIQLEAMRKYHVCVTDLPDVVPKTKKCLHEYHERLKEVLIEQSIRHWIATYATYYRNRSMSDYDALLFRNYACLTKEETHVKNPWQKPSFWLTKTKVSRRLPFE